MATKAMLLKMTRAELHELVWTMPLHRIAGIYGASSLVVVRLCEAMNVPMPAVRNWPPDDPPLPRTLLPRPDDHKLVARTRKALATGEEDSRRIVSAERGTYLDVRVSRKSMERALCIMNTLVWHLEARGHAAAISDTDRHITLAIVGGQEFQFRIEEQVVEVNGTAKRLVTRRPPPDGFHGDELHLLKFHYVDWDATATGVLTIHASNSSWGDTPGSPLEEKVQRIIVSWEEIAEELRRSSRAAARRHRSEAKRAERRNESAEELGERLARQVAAWARGQQIRAYLAAVSQEIEPGDLDGEAWLARARAHVDANWPAVIPWHADPGELDPRPPAPTSPPERVVYVSREVPSNDPPGWAWNLIMQGRRR